MVCALRVLPRFCRDGHAHCFCVKYGAVWSILSNFYNTLVQRACLRTVRDAALFALRRRGVDIFTRSDADA